ncbi:NUDIX domain protein [Anatilimnocola aggregata]|uniref:NUDIX domain protein n=1 Tax=Anatilimnocola aggregata TaxID=2528021 RepID=A0A517YFU7_9BACT|nr:NUDIX domain-containing protein [Anatilimnocola aggregata]QDU29096.1 NUDIX domain protein [Anatilimnocola aggregata]
MPKVSAGLLMYRVLNGRAQVLLAHPGGPYFRQKDEGAWTIPKGEADDGEDLLDTAQREFTEETGHKPTGPFVVLSPVKQKGGKVVHAWAFEGAFDPAQLVSNTFNLEWPPRSGQQVTFPEVDRAEWFDLTTAKWKINSAQVKLLEELEMTISQK